jgi:hypothetical protein
MRHLARAELVDSLDGLLPPDRAAHLEACARCREEAHELSEVLRNAGGIAVPDPSPLFWDHFSARVSEAVAATPPPRAAAWGERIRRRGPLLAAGAACLILAFAVLRMPGSLAPTGTMSGPAVLESAIPSSSPSDSVADDDAWSLVQLVADEVPLQEAQEAGLVAAPGSAERMALELSPRERAELAVLLRHELKGSGL